MQSGGVGQMKKQIVGILLVALSGCHVAGTATMVRTTRAWGELTLSGTYLDRVADAVILMATHCDGPFSVVDHDSETGFTETPSPEQTRVQFVCPARVETRRYRQAQQHRTAGGERSTPRSLVIPGSVTEAAPAIALTASVTTAASPTALTTASPTIASAEASEPPATSPALALSPPMPSQMSMSSSAASPSATSPATPSPPD